MSDSRTTLKVALSVAPLGALLASVASWLHRYWSGGLRLAEFPRSDALVKAGLLAALGLVFVGACCVQVYRKVQRDDLRDVWRSSLLMHLAFLTALPLLSNDLYTYLTYGELSAHGINPHLEGPGALAGSELAKLTPWTNTPSVYGPVSDLMNAVTGYIGRWTGSSVWAAFVAYKLMVAVLDLGTLYAFARLAESAGTAGAVRGYSVLAMNPLVGWEVAGQGHNDGLLVAAAICFLVFVRAERHVAACVALVMGILGKFMLAPTLALYLRVTMRQSLKRTILLVLVAICTSVVLFAPFWAGADTFTILKGPKPINEGLSLYTVLWKVLRVLQADPGMYRTSYLAFVWTGRVLVLALAAVIFFQAETLRDVERGSIVLLLAIVGTSAIMLPWYLTWLVPFVAVESDERWQRLGLGLTVAVAPCMGVPFAWLLLPLAQIVGLAAVVCWWRPKPWGGVLQPKAS